MKSIDLSTKNLRHLARVVSFLEGGERMLAWKKVDESGKKMAVARNIVWIIAPNRWGLGGPNDSWIMETVHESGNVVSETYQGEEQARRAAEQSLAVLLAADVIQPERNSDEDEL